MMTISARTIPSLGAMLLAVCLNGPGQAQQAETNVAPTINQNFNIKLFLVPMKRGCLKTLGFETASFAIQRTTTF